MDEQFMKQYKIAIGDLRHKTVGRHSILMPLGIGYIAAYTKSIVDSKDVEIRLYGDSDVLLKDIDDWKPDVVALSNYCWNSELSRIVFNYARKVNPDIVCIAGGPEFPTDQTEARDYLLERSEIDFYVYLEGEVAFARLIQKLQNEGDIHRLKIKPHDGIMFIHPETKDLVVGKQIPFITNMDEIPSPYLSGIMDQFFDGNYAPSLQTARGCPFSCGYCHTGQSIYNHVAFFSIQRIKDELKYIACRMEKYPNVLLEIVDSNFGMYKHDEEIADYITFLQDTFNWPNAFGVSTGKTNYDQILRIASRLKNKMNVTCSLQSFNPATLDIVKRANILADEYIKIQQEIKARGMRSIAEFIIPMPEETKTSFFEGVKFVADAGVESVVTYTTMLLKGTYLASKECRIKYGMQTKFRILPSQFGEYNGEKCFEIEEVCVATNTMSFEDYLDCRGFALVSSIYSDEQFDIIFRHLEELGIGRFDYIYHLWELIKTSDTPISEIYNRYVEETIDELWNSRDAIYSFFTKPENYHKLKTREFGDNLMRKYRTEVFVDRCIPSIELAYSAVETIAGSDMNQDIHESLDAAKRWMIALRNIGAVFKNKNAPWINTDNLFHLPYDVDAWYSDCPNQKTLVDYNIPVNYRVYCDDKKLMSMLNDSEKLYGENIYFLVGKLLVNWSVKDFWKKCECEG